MRMLAFAATLISATAGWAAEPMTFKPGGNDTRCRDCYWIQASGEITADTPRQFEAYLGAAPPYAGGRIRLDSPGGNLAAAIELGEMFRARKFATEVGADKVDPEGHPAVGSRASVRIPGVCASACAYAFLGGVERTLDGDAMLGFHRFYRDSALAEPTAPLFSGQDLDDTQRVASALALYIVKMGADARILALAATAGADEMRWISQQEAPTLGITYEPRAWQPWRVEAYRGGAIAISETNDKSKRMVASCTPRFGPQVVLTDETGDYDVEGWFEQARKCPSLGFHPVFGTQVDPASIRVIKRAGGGAIMRFRLPTNNPPLTSPALLDRDAPDFYSNACSSIDYKGSTENFRPAVALALRNCFED